MTGPIVPPPSSERICAFTAWRNALGIVVLLWLVVGLANLGFLADFLATTLRDRLVLAALLLDIGFTVAVGLVVLIGLFLAFGEELAMRGLLMENLRRGGMPVPIQVVASGISTGSYHGIVGLSYSPAYASCQSSSSASSPSSSRSEGGA